jgi:hypothetical protein
MDRMTERASDMTDTVSRSVSSAADSLRSTGEQVPEQMSMAADQVLEGASRLIEQNPLAVAGAAVIMGAALGMALPPTRTEQQLLGSKAAELAQQAQSAVTQPLQRLEEEARSSS